MGALIDPKYRVATVEIDGRHGAAIICISYYLNSEKRVLAIEYWEVVTNQLDSNLSIPGNRAATFKEELRVLKKAASFYEGARNDEKKHIEQKMREAYGPGVVVNFDQIANAPL